MINGVLGHIIIFFITDSILVLIASSFFARYIDIRKKSEEYGFFSAWNLLRITNMLIIVRLFRIIPSIKVNFLFSILDMLSLLLCCFQIVC